MVERMEKNWDTGKDEAEFILIVGKFKIQDEDHREADPGTPGVPHTQGRGHTFASARLTVPRLTVRIRAQELGESGLGVGGRQGPPRIVF